MNDTQKAQISLTTNHKNRNNYAAAKLQGLEKDLGLTPVQYETGLSVLFVGYILMQVPSNMMLNYIGRPSLYLGFWVCAWGLVSALTSQVKGYGSIVACRFILGFVGTFWTNSTSIKRQKKRAEGRVLTEGTI
jgi:MFS family permease